MDQRATVNILNKALARLKAPRLPPPGTLVYHMVYT